MIHNVIYHADAIQDLEKLNHHLQTRIIKAIEERLTKAPEIYGKPLRYSLKGLWSLRTGDYRCIYRIEKDAIIILRIGHRKEVYDN